MKVPMTPAAHKGKQFLFDNYYLQYPPIDRDEEREARRHEFWYKNEEKHHQQTKRQPELALDLETLRNIFMKAL